MCISSHQPWMIFVFRQANWLLVGKCTPIKNVWSLTSHRSRTFDELLTSEIFGPGHLTGLSLSTLSSKWSSNFLPRLFRTIGGSGAWITPTWMNRGRGSFFEKVKCQNYAFLHLSRQLSKLKRVQFLTRTFSVQEILKSSNRVVCGHFLCFFTRRHLFEMRIWVKACEWKFFSVPTSDSTFRLLIT